MGKNISQIYDPSYRRPAGLSSIFPNGGNPSPMAANQTLADLVAQYGPAHLLTSPVNGQVGFATGQNTPGIGYKSGGQQAQNQQPQQGGLGQAIDLINTGRNIYNLPSNVSNIYNGVGRIFGGEAAKQVGGQVAGQAAGQLGQVAANEGANVLFNQAAGEASQQLFNQAATQSGGGLAGGEAAGSGYGGALSGGLAALYGIYKVASNLKRNLKAADGTGLTDDEIYNSFGNAGMNQLLDKGTGGLHKTLSKLDPVRGIAKAIWGSTKSEDQINRDRIRKNMEKGGLAQKVGDSYAVSLADGSQYDIGKDGHFQITNKAGKNRGSYDVDLEDANSTGAIPYADAISAILTGNASDKARSDSTGFLVNAATSNSSDPEGIKNNLRAIAGKSGLTTDQAHEALGKLREAGRIDDNQLAVWKQSIGELLGGAKTAGTGRRGGSKDNKNSGPAATKPVKNTPLYNIFPFTQPGAPVSPQTPTDLIAQYQSLLNQRNSQVI